MTGIDKDADAVRDALNVRPHTGTQPHLDALGALDRLAATARNAEFERRARKTTEAVNAREVVEHRTNLLARIESETARAEAAGADRDRLARRVERLAEFVRNQELSAERAMHRASGEGYAYEQGRRDAFNETRAVLSPQPTEPQEEEIDGETWGLMQGADAGHGEETT